MKSNKVFCDHCGKELDAMKDFDDTQIEMAHKWTTVDLCNDCGDKLWEIINKFCSARESQ